ncbi:MAG: TIGR00266 family protein [Planctomycetes bacterium]|nr:TIGR00266 family protein [Planctomycetota bacterium]
MEYDIRGTVMQTVDVWLQAGESVYTESGGMAWMTPNVEMETGAKGGLLKGLGRTLAHESFFLTTYACTDGRGLVAFASEFPGKILAFPLEEGQSIICQKDAFMCAESGVELAMHFRKKLGAGFFGGEGFILQKLTGPGTAFVEIAGELTEYELKEGQTLKVDQGHIGAMEPTVDFDISRVKGLKNILFSGEGLFLATVKGPGKVWLQSMPLANLANKIASRIPSK